MEDNEKKSIEVAGAESQSDAAVGESAERAVAEGVNGEQITKPSREQILAISRKENKKGDEREVQENLKGMGFAYSVGILICGIVYLVDVLAGRETPVELMMAYMGMTAVWAIYYAVKTSKHRALFVACGVLSTVTFLFFTVFWILKLCGVNVD